MYVSKSIVTIFDMHIIIWILLQNILTCMLKHCALPNQWKKAHVTPMLKYPSDFKHFVKSPPPGQASRTCHYRQNGQTLDSPISRLLVQKKHGSNIFNT